MAASSSQALSLRFMWGVNSSGRREGIGASSLGVDFLDEKTVVYAAGHAIVLYDTEEKKQRFIGGSTEDDGFSAMAMCPSKRFFAVAEMSPDHASIVVFDLRTLRKRKVLTAAASCSRYSSICFSRDNETLLALAGTTIVSWRWAKGKVTAELALSLGGGGGPEKTPDFFQCSFSKLDSIVAACATTGIVFARVDAEELTALPVFTSLSKKNSDESSILCHCWLKQVEEDYCVAGLSSGKIVLFRGCSYLCHLDAHIDEKQGGISSACAVTNGFVAGSTAGSFHMFGFSKDAGTDPKHLFTMTHSFGLAHGDCSPDFSVTATTDASGGDKPPAPATAPQDSLTKAASQNSPRSPSPTLASGREIVSISIRPESEDMLVAITSDKQLLGVSLSDKVKSDDVKPLICNFHGLGVVTGLDVCIRKPLVATTASDKTLRIWNYLSHELELCKYFPEDPYSVTFHPSGLHVIVGFSDKLRLLNLLVDDARVSREVPIKACRECHFSNGGQYFAAVNGNVVAIYEFYTCEKLLDLRGHNSKVRSLYWSKDDHSLVSCGQDGAVYQWDWYEGKRSGEFVQKGTVYNSALCTSSSVFAVGNDHMIKELETPELAPIKQLDSSVNLAQIALSGAEHMMFAATADEGKPGCVRAYSFPLTGDFLEYACAARPLTRIRVSHDDTHLLVASEDGCVCVFNVRDRQERQQRALADGSGAASAVGDSPGSNQATPSGGTTSGSSFWSDEILVTKSDLEERSIAQQELKNKIEELQLHNEYQLRLKEMSYSEKIKELTEKYMQDLEQEKNKFELLREEKNDIEMECDERYKQMEDAHHHELQQIENKYQQRIMAEVEKYQQLENERDLQDQRWKEQRTELTTALDAYLSELTEDFEHKLEEDKQQRAQLEDEKAELDREFVETKSQLEEDIDTEIQNLRQRYDSQLAAEREATLRYKGENGIMKKKFSVLTKEIEDQKEEIKALLAREKELQEQIAKLEREIMAHKAEIKKRDDVIGTKEKKIYELKKKNQELEKFKFVLDYKIKELKRQIEPREAEIADMKAQIKTMDNELEQYHKSNAQLDLMIGELRSKLDSMQKEVVDWRNLISDREAAIRRFKADLHDCAQHIQDPPKLAGAVEALNKRHNPKMKIVASRGTELDADVISEYKRQEESLRQSLDLLRKQFQSDMAEHSAENMRIMTSNMGLIREINKQREANRKTRLSLQAEEAYATNEAALRRQRDDIDKEKNQRSPEPDQQQELPEDDDDEDQALQLRIEALQGHADALEIQLRERGLLVDEGGNIVLDTEEDEEGDLETVAGSEKDLNQRQSEQSSPPVPARSVRKETEVA